MGKALKITLIVLGVVLILLVAGGMFAYKSIFSSSITKAELSVQEGQVLVNGETVTSRALLNEGDKIETKEKSRASVVLYESVVIDLEENTTISLADLVNKNPKVTQESGETWNQFTKLSGVEGYSIGYGETVASVRGTGFALAKDKMITGEGNVEYTAGQEKFNVAEGNVVERKNGKYAQRKMTQEERAVINRRLEQSISELRILREREINKSNTLYSLVKSRLNMSDGEIRQKLIELDESEVNLKEIVDKSPVKAENVNRLVAITEKIREIKKSQKVLNE